MLTMPTHIQNAIVSYYVYKAQKSSVVCFTELPPFHLLVMTAVRIES